MPTLDISQNIAPLIRSKGRVVRFTMMTGHEFSGRVEGMTGTHVDLTEAIFHDDLDEIILHQLELPLAEIMRARLL